MSKKMTDKELLNAKVPTDEFDDSIKQMLKPPQKKGSAMDNQQTQMAILKILYEHEKSHGRNSGMSDTAIAETLSINEKEVIRIHIPGLLSRGLVEHFIDALYRITNEGKDLVDPDSPFAKKEITPVVMVGDQNKYLSGGSQDNSLNVLLKDTTIEFDKLNNTINNSNDIPDNVKIVLLELTNKMKATAKTKDFKSYFDEFIQKSAPYMNVLGYSIPFLTDLFF